MDNKYVLHMLISITHQDILLCRILEGLCYSGNLVLFGKYYGITKFYDWDDFISKAAYGGHIEMLNFLFQINKWTPAINSFQYALANGHLDAYIWLIKIPI